MPIWKRRLRSAASRIWPVRTSIRLTGSPADFVLNALAAGEEITVPVLVVAAHPDDEAIGIGARMRQLRDLTLLHVTNGAPDRAGARLAGFPDAASYGAARFVELERVLAILQVQGAHRRTLNLIDGTLEQHLDELVSHLTDELSGKAAVITHAYEGGHPDHDACAFAVQMACSRLARSGPAPLRLEYTGYHSYRGDRRVGTFWPEPGTSTAVVRLSSQERRIKRAAYAAYESQAWIQSVFPVDRETYRTAPQYDFTRPPAPGAWLYDTFGWEMKGATWLECAKEALRRESQPLR